jgi:hypothetical protein
MVTMNAYRNTLPPKAPGVRRERVALDVGAAVLALMLAGIEVTLQIVHGGAWGAEPTIALAIGAASAWALLRAIFARRAPAHELQTDVGLPGGTRNG